MKVFRPTEAEAGMLEQSEPLISFADYRQPYRSMVVEYPPGYAAARADGVYRPAYAIVARLADTLFVSVVEHGPNTRHTWLILTKWAVGDRDIEAALRERDHTDSNPLTRTALNAMLYLSAKGVIDRGYLDPDRAERLRRQKKKRPDKWEAIQAELRGQPREIAPVRAVAVRPPSEPAEPGPPTGRKVRPHERRGHFKMQACGVRWSERRLIFVDPYTVGDVPAGSLAGQVTTYTTPAGEPDAQ